MFTGLIEQVGTIIQHDLIDEKTARLAVETTFDTFSIGESIAIEGVCLTCLPGSETKCLLFDLSSETRSRTTLQAMQVGAPVHLERAVLASQRLGGHYVSGHVDTTACLTLSVWHGQCLELTFSLSSAADKLYVFPKGSITLSGVSLTINEVGAMHFTVMLIPHTLHQTRLGQLEIGQCVNVEFDYLARICAHQLKCLRG